MADIRDDRDVGRTPGKVEGGEDQPKLYPSEPGETPGQPEIAEENFDERRRSVMGDEYADPGTLRSPEPTRPD